MSKQMNKMVGITCICFIGTLAITTDKSQLTSKENGFKELQDSFKKTNEGKI